MLVSFMGNDGGGKSTTIREVRQLIEKSGKKTSCVPGFEHLLIGYLKKLYAWFSRENISDIQREYSGNQRRRLFAVWPYFVFIDCCLLLLKHSLRKNEVILMDRHPYDYVASFEELGISSPLIRRLFLLLPRTKHIFLFDASPEVARERKKADHTGDIRYYERQRARYLKLAEEKRIPVLNTDSLSVKEVARAVYRVLEPSLS